MKRFLKPISLMMTVILLVISLVSLSRAVEKPGELKKKIDLSLTLKYLQDWSARDKWDKFPESPSFAYYNIYSLQALKADISPELRKKVVDTLKGCQAKDGGFSAGPAYGTDANIIFTYYALATLDLLKALDEIDQKQSVSFIRSLVQKDGGIKARISDAGATLASTYYGVASLGLLKALDTVDAGSVIAYINMYREPRQGYCIISGKISMPVSTTMAVKALALLNGLNTDIKTEVVQYLKNTRYSGLVKNRKYTMLPSMQEMAAVLETLADLSSLQVINKGNVYKFIESLYIPENGGFGPEPGLGTTPPSTYYAIVCLDKIGKLGKKIPKK